MAENVTQIREAAESLLYASPRNSYAHSNFMRSPEIILSSDLTAGSRHHGKMSDVRRSFCLLVTFDLLFTSLMWLICTMIAGEDMNTAFIDQIVHYRVDTSLFDIVMAAICRFTVLLLFYALLYMNHWIIIALSTAGTCVFLITKVFLFDWKRYDQPVFQVLLILSSFILAWAEALLFDLRVIPQETQARDWFRSFTDPERSPLQHSASVVPHYRSTDVVNTFFTPVDSPNLSDDEDNRSRSNSKSSSRSSTMFPPHPLPPPTKEKMEEYKRIASSLLRSSHDLLTSTAWKVMTVTSDGDIVSFMQLPKPEGKILKISGTINKSAKCVVDCLYDEIEQSPRWNKCVMESSILQGIDEDSDIVYQSTYPQGGGIIGSRDFVILRRRGKYGNFHISSGISVILDSVPPRKNYIRGDNGVGCWAAEDISEGKSRFTWIVNTNLKGWLPQQIVDMAMSSVMLDFMKHFRIHLYETHVAVA